MTLAEEFKKVITQLTNLTEAIVEIKGGVVFLTFPDNSVLNFTEPMAYTTEGAYISDYVG